MECSDTVCYEVVALISLFVQHLASATPLQDHVEFQRGLQSTVCFCFLGGFFVLRVSLWIQISSWNAQVSLWALSAMEWLFCTCPVRTTSKKYSNQDLLNCVQKMRNILNPPLSSPGWCVAALQPRDWTCDKISPDGPHVKPRQHQARQVRAPLTAEPEIRKQPHFNSAFTLSAWGLQGHEAKRASSISSGALSSRWLKANEDTC